MMVVVVIVAVMIVMVVVGRRVSDCCAAHASDYGADWTAHDSAAHCACHPSRYCAALVSQRHRRRSAD
jgi:hypothetical protein